MEEHVQLLNGTKDLLLKQQTPIRYAGDEASCMAVQAVMLCASSLVTPQCRMHLCRVSQRRADLVRERLVHSMSCQLVPGSPHCLILRLRTQACA